MLHQTAAQAAGKRRCGADRNLLPKDRPHAKLKRIERAGNTQAGLPPDPRREPRIECKMSRNDVRPSIQIEQIPQADENPRQRGSERGGEVNR